MASSGASGGAADRIRANCALRPGPLAPEIALYQAVSDTDFWRATEQDLAGREPFWAFAWAGGQALARYLLDNPKIARGRSVTAVACGGGAEAIAAAMSGAAQVRAYDIDPDACAAAALNAAANEVFVDIRCADPLTEPPPRDDLLLVGDVFYDRALAARLWPWVEGAGDVLIGDPGRSYLPKDALEAIASYRVAWTGAVEDSDLRHTRVWRPLAR